MVTKITSEESTLKLAVLIEESLIYLKSKKECILVLILKCCTFAVGKIVKLKEQFKHVAYIWFAVIFTH